MLMLIKKLLKCLLISLFYIFLSFSLSLKASAIELFTDQFNTFSLDTNKWLLLNETNADFLTGNSLLVSGIDSNKSLFVETKNSLDTSNGIEYKIRFRFISYGFGSGIALNDNPVSLRVLNGDPNDDDWTVVVWPTGPDSFKVFSMICLTTGNCLPNNNVVFEVSGLPAFEWHTLFVRYENNSYRIRLDNSQELQTVDTNRAPKIVWLGNPMITGGTVFSSFETDYIEIRDLNPSLSFPYLSQKNPLWGSKEYDSATQWAGVDKSGIDRWGCALTSTAMILQKYGVKSLDGSTINPDILNSWLKSQKDGYVGPGLLNWLAVTRYVKESYAAGHADTKLEFVRSYLPTTPILPVILGIPGHFVVAYDEDTTNWKINDPASTSKTTLAKTSTVKSVNRFVLSQTDLSYMLFVADTGSNVSLLDEKGKPINIDWIDESLVDDIDGSSSPTVKTAMLPKPQSGKYSLKVDNPTKKQNNIDVYFYDTDGDVWSKKVRVGNDTNITFELKYDKANIQKSKLNHVRRWKMVWDFKKRWWNKIWDLHDRWEERNDVKND